MFDSVALQLMLWYEMNPEDMGENINWIWVIV